MEFVGNKKDFDYDFNQEIIVSQDWFCGNCGKDWRFKTKTRSWE